MDEITEVMVEAIARAAMSEEHIQTSDAPPVWKDSCGGWGPTYIETDHGDYEVATTGDGKWWVTPPDGNTNWDRPFASMADAKSDAERMAAQERGD